MQGLYILVAQTDTALAGIAGHGRLVAGRAVDTNGAVFGHHGVVRERLREVQTHEPMAIGQYAAAAVAEVVAPGRGILDLGYTEGVFGTAFGGTAVAVAGFLSLVLGIANGEMGCQYCVTADDLIDIEPVVGLRNHDEAVLTHDLLTEDDRRIGGIRLCGLLHFYRVGIITALFLAGGGAHPANDKCHAEQQHSNDQDTPYCFTMYHIANDFKSARAWSSLAVIWTLVSGVLSPWPVRWSAPWIMMRWSSSKNGTPTCSALERTVSSEMNMSPAIVEGVE